MERSIETRWVDLYLSGLELMGEGCPGVLNRPRSAALESFNLLGIPPKGPAGTDRYHYTGLRDAFAAEYEYYFTPSYPDTPHGDPTATGHRITLTNGFCRDDKRLTSLDNGVVFGSLAAAAEAYPELVARHYRTLDAETEDVQADLTAMFAQDGAFVYLPSGVEEPTPFVVECILTAEGEAVASFARHLFILEANSAATVAIDYQSAGGERLLGGYTREVFLAPGARLELVETASLNLRSTLLSGSYARQERDSRLHSLWVARQGGLLLAGQAADLEGPGADNQTNGLLLSGAGERFDLATDVRHRAPGCTSDQQIRSVAGGDGQAVFSGRIYVAPDAQRTRAFQRSNSLVLGHQAVVDTKPQLEIYADDVKCSHGATVGQLDAEAIYYMRQRGLSSEEARRLQLYGFAREVLSRVPVEGFSESLDASVINKIDQI